MKKSPEISILIPAFNAEKTIKPAIWSVLNQSFTHFELLILNDGSTDNTAAIIESFNDSRIRFINQTENKGIVYARNMLVENAKGRFIAWLDADDIMMPNRLSTQYNYLDVHPAIFMAASAVNVRNDQNIKNVQWPGDSEIVKAWMFFRNPLVQSSLMLRNEKQYIQYDSAFEYLEDYDFYSRIFTNKNIVILPEYLCSYYQDKGEELIHKYRKYDFVNKLENIMRRNFSLLQIQTGKNELSLIREFLRTTHKIKKQDSEIILAFLNTALVNNKELRVFENGPFKSIVFYQYIRLFKYSKTFSFSLFLKLLFHPFACISALNARPRYQ